MEYFIHTSLLTYIPIEIQQDTGFKSVELQLLDLSKFSSVTQFVDNFLKTYERLDILLANAAVAPTVYKATADGWEEGYLNSLFF